MAHAIPKPIKAKERQMTNSQQFVKSNLVCIEKSVTPNVTKSVIPI